jgi:hypothetical protein
MDKRSQMAFVAVLLLIFANIFWSIYSMNLNQTLVQKETKIGELMDQNLALENQLSNQQKPTLVTSLGVSTEPRNVTYPHPHFTIEGVVFNVGSRTAFSARLDIVAFYKNGLSAFNMSIPLGNLERWQVTEVNKIIATSDWIGNYTITTACNDSP